MKGRELGKYKHVVSYYESCFERSLYIFWNDDTYGEDVVYTVLDMCYWLWHDDEFSGEDWCLEEWQLKCIDFLLDDYAYSFVGDDMEDGHEL